MTIFKRSLFISKKKKNKKSLSQITQKLMKLILRSLMRSLRKERRIKNDEIKLLSDILQTIQTITTWILPKY